MLVVMYQTLWIIYDVFYGPSTGSKPFITSLLQNPSCFLEFLLLESQSWRPSQKRSLVSGLSALHTFLRTHISSLFDFKYEYLIRQWLSIE